MSLKVRWVVRVAIRFLGQTSTLALGYTLHASSGTGLGRVQQLQ